MKDPTNTLTIEYTKKLKYRGRELVSGDVLKFRYGARMRIVAIDEPINGDGNLGGWDLSRKGAYRTFKIGDMYSVEEVGWLYMEGDDD